MKKLKLKNNSIVKIYRFLDSISLKGQASRGRTKLQKRLQEKEKEYIEEKETIQKQYIELDADGEFVVLEDGVSSPLKNGLSIKEKELFLEKIKELDNDTFEISFVEYSEKYEELFKELYCLDKELVGEEAEAYDVLMESYEQNEMEEK